MSLFNWKNQSRNTTNVDLGQTEFSSESPMFEPNQRVLFDARNIKGNRNLSIFYILAAVLVFIFLIIFLYAKFYRPPTVESPIVPTPTPVNNDPLMKRVESLDVELKAADPMRQALPFPNVDLKFNLD